MSRKVFVAVVLLAFTLFGVGFADKAIGFEKALDGEPIADKAQESEDTGNGMVAVTEAYGFADKHILRLENQHNHQIYLNGVTVDGRNVFNLYYGNFVDSDDPFQRVIGGICFNVYQLKCNIPLEAGDVIYIQYDAYDGWSGNWGGEPADVCGMKETNGNHEVYFNGLREYARANVKIHYTSSGVVAAQDDIKITLGCLDYDFRCTTSNDCMEMYSCPRGSCSTNSPGMCMAAC